MGKFIAGIIAGIIVVIIVAAGAGYGAIATGRIPAAAAGARALPLERWAAQTSLRATLTREAPKGVNPVKLNDANLLVAINLYQGHCAVCHGGAKGNAAPTPTARGEYPAPPQLATDGVEDDAEGWTWWKIENGIRWTGMPGWKDTLTPQDAWTLTLFLKHMDKLPPGSEVAWQQVK
ncbi:MAG: c-type cytochrome [Stellaceae bacterium]